MAYITLKNIPNDLYEDLKEQAARNHRSLNNEIIVCIQKAVRRRKTDKSAMLVKIQKIRDEINAPYLTQAELDRMKRERFPR